jgi:hypothetical protein
MRRRPDTANEQSFDPDLDLHACVACGRDFVQPVSWEPVGEHSWWMFLRCAECGVSRDVVVPNAVADRFESELHARASLLARELRRLEGERMTVEVDTFVDALQRDLIEPSDFYRYSAGL